MRKIHCQDCRVPMLQWVWDRLNPIRFFTNSRSFCQGTSPWKFYSYLPIAAFRFYRGMIPDVLRDMQREV
jgi:hypothetical protein